LQTPAVSYFLHYSSRHLPSVNVCPYFCRHFLSITSSSYFACTCHQ
jgi:hypothetical protein